MRKVLTFVILGGLFVSCSLRSIKYEPSNAWMLTCIDLLFSRYDVYVKQTIDKCYKKDKDTEYKIFTHMLFDFNFNDHYQKILKYTRINKIQYDSIYMVLNFDASFQIREFPTINAGWYIFRNETLVKSLSTIDYIGKVSIDLDSPPKSFLDKDLSRKDGCDDGLVVVTVIYTDNKFKLVHMALNADKGIMYD